jgi:hypothetical protein
MASVNSVDLNEVVMNNRVLSCLSLYDDFVTDETLYVKQNLKSISGSATPIRLYFKFDKISVHEDEVGYSLSLVLIDLFHLVIPSDHNGLSAEKMLKKTFHDNVNNMECISDYIGKSLIE